MFSNSYRLLPPFHFKTKVTFGHNLRYKTKKVRLVKFLSNFVKRIGMLPETMKMLLLMNYQVNQLIIYTLII